MLTSIQKNLENTTLEDPDNNKSQKLVDSDNDTNNDIIPYKPTNSCFTVS